MEKNIFMIGMPSSGKSTLGKQIAKALSYEFIDLDQKIEFSEGKKIADIFSLHGEEYFRKIEAEQLRKIPVNSRIIIATGGGTPCFHDGINYIKENGWSIFLDVPPFPIFELVPPIIIFFLPPLAKYCLFSPVPAPVFDLDIPIVLSFNELDIIFSYSS